MIPDESDIPDIPDDPDHPTPNKKMMLVLLSYLFDKETLLWTEKAIRIVILYPSCILNLAGYVRVLLTRTEHKIGIKVLPFLL